MFGFIALDNSGGVSVYIQITNVSGRIFFFYAYKDNSVTEEQLEEK